jgi:NhaP-type Na+/H+ or K+/H+ antiporter
MDFNWLLFSLSAVVLVSYLFDFVGRYVKVPAVVMLIGAGIGLRLVLDTAGLEIPFLDTLLPVIGTLGLILIVLEASLDLELSREKAGLMWRSLASALLGLAITGAAAAAIVHLVFGAGLHQAWIYATPLAVISSAVAIPAAAALHPRLREFVVYESALSDIFGVLLFYILIQGTGSFGFTALKSMFDVAVSAVVGLVFALSLYWIILRIDHHVRFLPMIFGLALLYAVGKILHLAPLMMVMIVGLVLNNHALLARVKRLSRHYDPEFGEELDSFKHLTAEFTFVVRTFFFVLLGYSTRLTDLADRGAWILAGAFLACVFLPRIGLVRAFGAIRQEPLIWFAPRGLITILLFLSIPSHHRLEDFPPATLMMVVLLSALALTVGMFRYRQEPSDAAAVDALAGEGRAPRATQSQ